MRSNNHASSAAWESDMNGEDGKDYSHSHSLQRSRTPTEYYSLLFTTKYSVRKRYSFSTGTGNTWCTAPALVRDAIIAAQVTTFVLAWTSLPSRRTVRVPSIRPSSCTATPEELADGNLCRTLLTRAPLAQHACIDHGTRAPTRMTRVRMRVLRAKMRVGEEQELLLPCNHARSSPVPAVVVGPSCLHLPAGRPGRRQADGYQDISIACTAQRCSCACTGMKRNHPQFARAAPRGPYRRLLSLRVGYAATSACRRRRVHVTTIVEPVAAQLGQVRIGATNRSSRSGASNVLDSLPPVLVSGSLTLLFAINLAHGGPPPPTGPTPWTSNESRSREHARCGGRV
ncbi:hypothetical protein RJ55_08268 [Drechmeria coniospora]|nr:hypothetical protein RJ55_08268 [Drechmeria coniospora]